MSSPSQTNRYMQSLLRDVGEVPLSPYLFSPPGALLNASTGNDAPLVAISPGIFSPGSKLLKKRYQPGVAGGMSSPDRMMILPGFQQSTVFETGQSIWEGHKSENPQSRSLWGNGYDAQPHETPQEYAGNRGPVYAAVTVSDKRAKNGASSSSSSSSSRRSKSAYNGGGGEEDNSASRSRSSKREHLYSHNLMAGEMVSPGTSAEDKSPRGVLDMGDSPVRVFRCNCKKSRCLKLYCDCFANLTYCSNQCNCLDCNNTKDHEYIRKDAIRTTKERNTAAFTSKVTSKKAHATGCHCKNSLCLKKYCECFQAGAHCGVNCKCQSCQNFEGSIALGNIKSSDRGGVKKRKGSPATTLFNNNVSADNTPEETQISNKAAKLGGAAEMEGGGRTKRTSTPPSAQPVGRVTRGSMNRNKPKPVLDEPEYEEEPSQEENVGREKTSQRARAKRGGRGSPAPPALTYPFFGNALPPCSKLVALSVLDMLSTQDLYSMSQVSSYWARASWDEALWTTTD